MNIVYNIMNIMDSIEYGFKDENGKNIITTNQKKWNKEFDDFYYLLSPDELLEKRCGVCFDQVELERKLFEENNIDAKTYFIYAYDDNYMTHTFLTYECDNKFYWFEHSWNIYKGIHEYSNITELLLDVKKKFIYNYDISSDGYTFVYEYKKPKYHITSREYYEYMESQKLIKLNKPLYFYHVINKDSDLSIGLFSLKYMYDNNMFEMFDKNVEKYKSRIVNDWNIEKYKNRKENSLTREEIIDALNTFRGSYGASYIYFFKYPPYKKLGKKIDELLKVKDIYRININDEEVEKNIKDIFYGYDLSNSDNKLLDKKYYENVTEEEYFAKYNDNLDMNFSNLNHISIAFKNDYLKSEFLEKVN